MILKTPRSILMLAAVLAVALSAPLLAATWTVPAYRPDSSSAVIFNPQPDPVVVTLRFQLPGSTASAQVVTLTPFQSLELSSRLPAGTTRGVLSIEAAASLVIEARDSGVPLLVFSLDDSFSENTNYHAIALPPAVAAAAALEILPVTPIASVEVLAYDRTQRELSKRTLDNLRVFQSLDLRQGAADPTAIERFEIRVLSGSVLAQLAYTLPNGRRQLLRWTSESDLPSRAFLPQIRRGENLRIVSFGTAGGRLTALPYGDAFANPAAAISDLPLGVASDFTDPLDTWFRAPADASATMRLSSSQPFLALAFRPGESLRAAASSLSAPVRLLRLLQPSAEAWVLHAGRGGSTGLLRIYNEAGTELGNFPFSLPEYSSTSILASNFLTGELPPRLTFLFVMSSGEVDAPISSSVQLYSCPLPEIEAAVSDTWLSAAQEVELSWSSSNAAQVFLQEVSAPGVAGPQQILDPSGSRRYSVAATRSFYLEARNACGAASRNVTVTLGTLRIRTLRAPTPTPAGGTPAAQPGDLVTLSVLENVSPELVQAVSVTTPAGRSVWVDVEVQDNGALGFTVPVIPAAAPELHYSGPVDVRLVTNDEEGPAQRLQINRLVYSGNAIADFRLWFDQYTAWASLRRAELAQVPGGAAFLSFMGPLLDANHNELRTELNQLAATGSVSLAMNQPSRAYPSPWRFTITAAEVTLIMALKQRLEARADLQPEPSLPRPASTSVSSNSKPGGPLAAATGDAFDLQLDPLYSTCLKLLNHELNAVLNRSIFDRLYDLLATTIDTTTEVATEVGQLRGISLFNKFRKLGGRAETFCQLYPMALTGFSLTSSPDPIPYLDFLETSDDTPPIVNRGTRINARFQSLMSKEQAASRAADVVGELIKQGAKGVTKKASEKTKNDAVKRAEEFAKRAHDAEADAIRDWLESNDAPLGNIERLVYKADIKADPIPTFKFLLRNEAKEARSDQANSPTWGFYGDPSQEWKGDQAAKVLVIPLARRFIFLDPSSTGNDLLYQNRAYASKTFPLDVTVGRARTGVRLQRATIGPPNRTPLWDDRPTNTTIRWRGETRSYVKSYGPQQTFFEHEGCRGVVADVGCNRGGNASLSVRAISKDNYRVRVEAQSTGSTYPNNTVKSQLPQTASVQVQFFNPPRFNNQQKVFLSWTSALANRSGAGIDNGRVTASVSCSLINAQGVSRTVGGTASGNVIEQGITSGTCTLFAGGDGNGRGVMDLTIRLTSY